MTDKDLTINVSLDYYAGGIKVDQRATPFGLGWSLNGGGCIIRELRDIPDGTSAVRKDLSDTFGYDSLNLSNAVKNLWLYQYINRSESRDMDLSPDIFCFNFCGRVGKFFLDSKLSGHCLNYEDLKIEMVSDSLFYITDEKGIVYTFSEAEWTSVAPLGSPFKYVSAWYLTSMVSPSGGKISFKYVTDVDPSYEYYRLFENDCIDCEHLRYSGSSLNWSLDYVGEQLVIRDKGICSSNCTKFTGIRLLPLSLTGAKCAMTLSEIRSSDGSKILIDYAQNERPDKGVRAKSISKLNSDSKVVKKYEFYHGYFTPDSKHAMTWSPTGNNARDNIEIFNNRLRLDSLCEFSNTNKRNSPYVFNYYGDDADQNLKHRLPCRFSPSQDHYGYYNGTENCSLVPQTTIGSELDVWFERFVSSSHATFKVEILVGADRKINEESVIAGTLKRIVYPTKGSTEFQFEGHTESKNVCFGLYPGEYLQKGGLRVKSITDYDGRGGIVKKRNFHYNSGVWDLDLVDVDCRYFKTFFQPRWFGTNPTYVSVFYELFDIFNPERNEKRAYVAFKAFPVSEDIQSAYSYISVTEEIEGEEKTQYDYEKPQNAFDISKISKMCPNIYDTYCLAKIRDFRIPDCDLPVAIKNPNYKEEYSVAKLDNIGQWMLGGYPTLHRIPLAFCCGDLVSEKKMSSSGDLLMHKQYKYERSLDTIIPGFGFLGSRYDNIFLLGKDAVVAGISRLKEETQIQYGVNGKIYAKKGYTYGNADYLKCPTEVKETRSDGKVAVTTTRYANDYTTTANNLGSLHSKHIIVPIETRTTIEGTTVSGTQVEYNANGQPLNIYSYTKGNVVFNKAKPYTFHNSVQYEYNNAGLLKSERLLDQGQTYHYVWGYGGQYPIAKIYNLESSAQYNTNVKNTLNQLGTTGTAFQNGAWQYQFGQTCGTKALAEFFDYIPSVGMSKQVGPDGQVWQYEYDDFNRLKSRTQQSAGSSKRQREKYTIQIGK